KAGRWDTFFFFIISKNYEQICGGTYEESEDGSIKIGKWVELIKEFKKSQQISYRGEYKKGKKVGIWDTWYNSGGISQKNQIMVGGLYDKMKNIYILLSFSGNKEVQELTFSQLMCIMSKSNYLSNINVCFFPVKVALQQQNYLLHKSNIENDGRLDNHYVKISIADIAYQLGMNRYV
ncbi:unnamed protein product, partial (macronuclear) [Paramecium tetraurelia]